jgi:ABC-2 type transport system permease protein
MNNLAFKALIFAVFIPVWLILCLLFRPDFSAVTAQNILLSIPAIILGFSINFFLGSAITSLAFWTTRVYSISEFFFALSSLMSGQFVPLELMPPLIQKIASFLPYQFIIYFPVEIILGRIPAELYFQKLVLGLAWLLALYMLFRWVWREGVKRFSAVGA